MNETLKHCPFCGSTKLKIESKRTFNYGKKALLCYSKMYEMSCKKSSCWNQSGQESTQ